MSDVTQAPAGATPEPVPEIAPWRDLITDGRTEDVLAAIERVDEAVYV